MKDMITWLLSGWIPYIILSAAILLLAAARLLAPGISAAGEKNAGRISGWLLTGGMGLSFFCLVLAVLTQVFARWLLPKVPSWTEEVSRFALIWLVGFGGGLAMRDRSYVNVDLLISLLPDKVRRLMAAGTNLLITFFMCTFMKLAWTNTIRMGSRQTSPALSIPMQYIFSALFVMAVGVIIFGALGFVGQAFRRADGLAGEVKGDAA